MMICKADFEELFPHIFARKTAADADDAEAGSESARAARPDRDGPCADAAPAPRKSRLARASRMDGRGVERLGFGAEQAGQTVLDAYSTAWLMLAGIEGISKHKAYLPGPGR